MRERRALRRVAAILFHRRAGFSANGMGVWNVPEERIMELGAADGRPSAASRTATSGPTYEDWPYSVFTMAHGRSKEECDAILDSIAEETGIEDRAHALLLDRVQEDPPPLLHRRAQAVGGGARLTAALGPLAGALRRALELLPGGVNSPVRAMRAIGRDPIFVARGEGAELVDVDGNRYVDWVCSWGPLIAGHAHPAVVEAVAAAAAAAARASARPPRPRCELAAEVVERVPGAEMVRMTSSGTEASMSAIRLARAATGRDAVAQVRRRLPRPRGRPARRGRLGAGHRRASPPRPGVTAAQAARHGGRAVERPRGGRARRSPSAPVAAILAEPYPANMGLVPPEAGFLDVPARAGRRAAARCWSSTR